jgi:hypothetical protein
MFLIIIGISSFFLAEGVMGQEPPPPNGLGIKAHLIVMPVGRILLVQREDFIAVVKFLYNEERKEGVYSKYEYFAYEKEKGFMKVRDGVISLKEPSRGVWAKLKGFLSFHDNPFRYGDKLEFKNFELFAHPASGNHTTVYFWNKPNKVDSKVRLAPTPWNNVREIKLSDPRIKWFGYDEKRKWRVIPIDKLWE